MPRANSRSSASATASFSPISSTVAREPAVAEPRLQHPQVEREADELLLRAVVQVALDPPAGVVGGLDDPQRARRAAPPRAPRSSAFSRSLSIASAAADAAAVTSSGDASSSASWTIAAHARAVALDRRPRAARAGLGQLDRVAAVVDEDLALGQPVGDGQRAVAEPLGQQLAHRSAGRARASAAAARKRARGPRRRRPRARRRETHRGGQREQAHAAPTAGPSAHGPTSAAVARQPAHAERDQRHRQQHRDAASASAASATGSRSSSIASTRRSAPRPSCSRTCRAGVPRRGPGCGTAGRCVSSRRLACRRSPSASRHASRDRAGQQRQTDPQRGERGAEREPAADHEQVRQPLAEADDHVQQRPPGGPQVSAEVERHGADSTVTSPVALSAWTANGASSAVVSPRTRRAPASLCASTW